MTNEQEAVTIAELEAYISRLEADIKELWESNDRLVTENGHLRREIYDLNMRGITADVQEGDART